MPQPRIEIQSSNQPPWYVCFFCSARAIVRKACRKNKRGTRWSKQRVGKGDVERKENPTGHPCCSAPDSYTQTLLRDVCCENTCLAPSTWTEAKHEGWGRTRSHREYYIPSTPRYTASHSVSFVDETRRTLRNSSTRVLLRPILDETPDISMLRLTPRERARDSSSIVAPLSLSWSFARSPLLVKRHADGIAGIFLSLDTVSPPVKFVCLPCYA